MHLDAVLVFISLYVHPLKLFRCIQLGDDAGVNLEIVERRRVFLADRQGTLPEPNMM